jgi:hypothetical protein
LEKNLFSAFVWFVVLVADLVMLAYQAYRSSETVNDYVLVAIACAVLVILSLWKAYQSHKKTNRLLD